MTRRNALLAVAAVLISIVAIAVGWKLGEQRLRPAAAPEVERLEEELTEKPAKAFELYFPGPGGRLWSEQREIALETADADARLGRLLAELLTGPESEELYAVLPPEITLGWVHLNPRGIAFVDLEVGGETPLPAWGSRREMLAIYSVVNTILLNLPEVRGVVLLRNGQQHSTFAGHLDTTRPLSANRELVASR